MDAAFSRLKVGKNFLDNHFKFKDVKLIMGDMLNMPIADDSCDIVYTVHACEPNGENEEKIIQELLRVTGKYLILFEPAYDLATEEAKRRMEYHGYVTRLYDVIFAIVSSSFLIFINSKNPNIFKFCFNLILKFSL